MPSFCEAEYLKIRLLSSGVLDALPDIEDRVLVCDALAYNCDCFCTRDYKTILKHRVERFANIVLNFDLLQMPLTPRGKLIQLVVKTVKDKFGSTNAIVTTEKIPGIENVKEVVIHNDLNFGSNIGGSVHAYGSANFENGIAHVNIENIVQDIGVDIESVEHLATAVGTIGSHEAGHLLSPRYHSMFDDTLLSSGTSDYLREVLLTDGGANLQFSQEQIQMMNWGIEAPEEMTQLIYGNSSLSCWEDILTRQDELVNAAPETTMAAYESGVWGSFEPDVIDSLDGLSGVENLADIESLGALTDTELLELSNMADGIFENIGDYLGEIDYGEIIEGLLNIV